MRLKKSIAIFILIAVLLMPVAVFADVPIPDPPYGAYNYWVVVQRVNGVYLITSPNKMEAPIKGTQIYANGGYKAYSLVDGYWSYDQEGLAGLSVPIETVYASNHDIAYTDGSGFFFTLPKVSGLYQAVRQAKDKGTFGMMWQTILAGLIPLAGLLTLGISLRKGWAFLKHQLMH